MSATFDIIFAGGGTTACVAAGRLTAANPALNILIIESGQHSRDNPAHVQPSRHVEHLAPGSTTVSIHLSKPSPHLNGRVAAVPCGRCIGGGSAINFMLYARGAASDYNDWHAMGNKGWSFDELLPLIRKLESFTPISDRPTHGYAGPIQISTGEANLVIGKQILDVAKAYDPTRPQVEDNNDFRTANAYSVAHRYVDPVTGKRSDSASRYLYPYSENPNVTIMVGKRVKRVIIEDGRAVGVEYTTDAGSPEGASDELITVKASKLVVLSAGTFGSPSILERSGVGSPSVLKKYNISALVDLPGVGENYQNHIGAFSAFYAADETETMDDVWYDSKAAADEHATWERDGKGKVAHNGIEVMVKVRPTEAQLASVGPALESRWKSFFISSPDKPLATIISLAGFPFEALPNPPLRGRKIFSFYYYIMYPESTGSVHITSGNDPNSPLDYDPNYFSKPGDIAQFPMLYKMMRELARRMPAYRGEVTASHPEFPSGSSAACKETNDFVQIVAPDIIYSEADDEAIVKFCRDSAVTTAHSLGTCAMKPREQGGVVDARLNVYGVQGLKVADMSICPTNVGNNTNSTALLIGEKAATIIAEELGIVLDRESLVNVN